MIKNKLTILSILILTTLNSCKKNNPLPTPSISQVTLLSQDIYKKTIKIKATVTSEGNSAVTDRGFCFNNSGNPSVSDNKIAMQYGAGEFSYTINNCSLDSVYYIKAYAMNSTGITYSSDLVVNLKTTKPEIQITKNAGTQSISVAIQVVRDGQSPILLTGCRIGQKDLSKDSSIYLKQKTGNNVLFDSLTPNTLYYLMGFAQNKNGSTVIFDTIRTSAGDYVKVDIPAITRLEANFIDVKSNIISNGGTEILEQGFILSTTSIVNINSGVKYSSNLIDFKVKVNSLQQNTKYYIRSYAKNYLGISMGPEITFITNYYNRGDFKDGGYVYWTSGQSYKVISYETINLLGSINWQQASKFADTTNLLGFSDWMLPDRRELLEACSLGAIQNGLTFWSNTQSEPNYHWIYAGCDNSTLRDDLKRNCVLVRQPR
jgi:hypothetical protein